MFRLSPLALAGALLATSLTVLSTTPVQAAVRHVHYGDLDLSTATGRATLDRRLRTAANSVCLAETRMLTVADACARVTLAQARVDARQAVQGSAVQVAAR